MNILISKHYKIIFFPIYKKSKLNIFIKKKFIYFSVNRNNIKNLIKNCYKFYKKFFFGYNINLFLNNFYNYNNFYLYKFKNKINILEIFNLFNNFILSIK